MKMKSLAVAAFAVALLGATACSGKTDARTSDSDSIKAAEVAQTETVKPVDADSIFRQVKAAGEVEDSTVYTTDTGLRYMVVKKGTGLTPDATDNVTVHYTGKFLDGTEFDSSVSRGEPATFPLNRVIPGWTEGLQLMKEGGKTVFYIPASLAYGEQGVPGAIPPNADLIFEVELLKVEK